jgi:hypothetical protein
MQRPCASSGSFGDRSQTQLVSQEQLFDALPLGMSADGATAGHRFDLRGLRPSACFTLDRIVARLLRNAEFVAVSVANRRRTDPRSVWGLVSSRLDAGALLWLSAVCWGWLLDSARKGSVFPSVAFLVGTGLLSFCCLSERLCGLSHSFVLSRDFLIR